MRCGNWASASCCENARQPRPEVQEKPGAKRRSTDRSSTFKLADVMGHEETYSTIQVDFHLPNQFGLEYTGADGKQHRPVMIHRGVISTMERMSRI